MGVIILTKISQVRICDETCGLAKKIEVKNEDIRYPLEMIKHNKKEDDDGDIHVLYLTGCSNFFYNVD